MKFRAFSLLLLCFYASPVFAFNLDTLMQGDVREGFRTDALYLDDRDHPMGARLTHTGTGLVVDLLQIQSVPQAYLWVRTVSGSDGGEAHALEHLIRGKGVKGRTAAAFESMSLVSSSASTLPFHTAYQLNTSAGPETFFRALEAEIYALLYPDFTDDEIRREVYDPGPVVEKDGSIRLEEKGTIYNEIVTAADTAQGRLWRAVQQGSRGPDLMPTFDSGGWPSEIRNVDPGRVRAYHGARYRLHNMGAIVALPTSVDPGVALSSLNAMLLRLRGTGSTSVAPDPAPDATHITASPRSPAKDPASGPGSPGTPGLASPGAPALTSSVAPEAAPRPVPATTGEVRFVDYPADTADEASSMVFAWRPGAKLSLRERVTAELLLGVLANSDAADLHRLLIASETRTLVTGASRISMEVSDEPGSPIYATLEDLPATKATEADARAAAGIIRDAFAAVAALTDRDAALAAFERRLSSQLLAAERRYRKALSTPPGFGIRGTKSSWFDHLERLSAAGGFKRSLTLRPVLEAIRAEIAAPGNPWATHLRQWGLLDQAPAVYVSRPSPALLKQLEADRLARLDAAAASIARKAGITDRQAALRAYQAEYQAVTARLEAVAASIKPPPFLEHPPLTLDPLLTYRDERQPGTGIPVVTSLFPGMSGATVGLVLRLDGVPIDRWVDLPALGALIGRVGVLEGGRPVPYDAVMERLQSETYAVEASFDPNPEAGRPAVVLTGTGTTLEESRAAVAWMARLLYHADWRPENLPRIRDVVNEELGRLRARSQGWTELWAHDPEVAWRWQSDPLRFATASFLTRTHSMLRLRWRLMGDDDASSAEAAAYLERLALAVHTRAEAEQALAMDRVAAGVDPAGLSEGARALVAEALKDLRATLPGVPDATVAQDWRYLCGMMAGGLRHGAAKTLAELEALRAGFLQTAGARLWMVADSSTADALAPDLRALTKGLRRGSSFTPVARPEGRFGWDRLRDHGLDPGATPVHVGLVMPALRGGIFTLSVPGASYQTKDTASLLDYLAALAYSGRGAHTLYNQTWAAGLAYSNGVRSDVRNGRLHYYAERCPELSQTLRFVVDAMGRARLDPALAEYAVGMAFATRSADAYESRGKELAEDLAEGRAPAVVSAFRQSLLALRRDPKLADRLTERLPAVYGALFPGLGAPSAEVTGGVFFSMGPERQLATLEDYLKSVVGPDARVYRLYPRDFWWTQ